MAKSQKPEESIILQAGVIFIIVSAIALFAYAFAQSPFK